MTHINVVCDTPCSNRGDSRRNVPGTHLTFRLLEAARSADTVTAICKRFKISCEAKHAYLGGYRAEGIDGICKIRRDHAKTKSSTNFIALQRN